MMSVMHHLDVTAPDGRTLEVLAAESGDLPLVAHHGTPGAADAYQPFADAAAQRGLRLVSYSRPGYGRSAPRPGRTVGSVVEDVATVLDALGTDRFVTYGWSGGGPHALACAALLPGRCLASACIAGVAPARAEGLDWLAGMGEENVEEFRAMAAGPDALSDWLTGAAAGLREVSADEIVTALGDLLPEADRAVLTGDFAENMAAGMRHALSAGIDGWLEDDLAFDADWGFDLAAIERPVTVWQGSEDRMVPFAHGQWLAAHVSGASVRLLDGEGHLSLMLGGGFERMLDDLLTAAG